MTEYNMYDLAIELPMQSIPLLDLDGVQVATLHDAPISEVAAAIKAQRTEGWKFLRTVRDRMRGVVMVMFKRERAWAE
jgi:hypothetical protein